MITLLRRFVASLLVVSIAGLGLPMPVHAGMVGTAEIVASASASERGRIASLLERADVQAQLQSYGVNPGEVKARVASLTDDEVVQLASQIDSLPAGGNALLGAIVLIFLVLLITDILGFTKIFPFTRSVR